MSDIISTTPSTLSRMVKHCFDMKRPMMVWGPPGVGKSDLIEQIGEETGRQVVDMRLILMEPTDIKGIPYYDREKKTMEWSVSGELPTEGTNVGKCILFLDEINSAPQSVQGAAYQLILNRRIGSHYKLPDETVIVAAGNRMTDRGVTYQMPSPLANRFVHFTLEHNFDDWLDWALNNGIRQEVTGFLSAHKQHLFDFDPKRLSTEMAFATPRTWAFASQLLTDRFLANEEDLILLLSGIVGQAKAIEFKAYQKLCIHMPKALDVLNGKVKEINKDLDTSVHYSLVISICNELVEQLKKVNKDNEKDVKKFDNYFKNFLNFATSNFSDEMSVFSLRTLLMNYKLDYSPSSSTVTKAWKEFAAKYKDYLTFK